MWDKWQEASMPKASWIRPVISLQYRLVTDGWTDEHTTTAYISVFLEHCVYLSKWYCHV